MTLLEYFYEVRLLEEVRPNFAMLLNVSVIMTFRYEMRNQLVVED